MVTGRTVEVEAPEEERAVGFEAQLLGAAAEMAPEHLGVGAGGEGVLAGDDLLGRVVDHAGQGGAAGLVVGPFAVEFAEEVGVRGGHSTKDNATR